MNKKSILVLIMLSMVALAGVPNALALSGYLNGAGSFNAKYPAAATTLGSSCLICHIDPINGDGGAQETHMEQISLIAVVLTLETITFQQ